MNEQTENKVLSSAIRIFHIRERAEWKNLFNVFVYRQQPEKIKGFSSVQIWFWGLKRWGNLWVCKEYEMRKR